MQKKSELALKQLNCNEEQNLAAVLREQVRVPSSKKPKIFQWMGTEEKRKGQGNLLCLLV